MTAVPFLQGSQPFRLTIADFELLEQAGVFEGHKKVQLIEGVLVEVNAEFVRHTRVKNELMYRLRLALDALGSRYTAVVEPTLALPPHNLPRPDVMVTDAPIERDYYRLQHAAIVIEVADTTLTNDLGAKCAMYAGTGVPEYWVVDIASGVVHQFWTPLEEDFSDTRCIPLGGPLASITMPDLTIDGRGIL